MEYPTLDSFVANKISLLTQGVIELEGLLPWSSNYTFLLRICYGESEEQAVYKPSKGERPLWDFPTGSLCKREYAAFVLSNLLGWHLVPPTVLRQGPHGLGSIQWFVPHNPEEHYFTFEGQFVNEVQQIVLFDALINNADRKSGHILIAENDKLWCIDHGVSFHTEYKLRTVVWEYAGNPIPKNLLIDLETLAEKLSTSSDPDTQNLQTLLSAAEVNVMFMRLNQLIESKQFPIPGPGRHYPWPLI